MSERSRSNSLRQIVGCFQPLVAVVGSPILRRWGYAASTWQWFLEPVAGGRRTRLTVRQRCTYSPRQVVLWRIVEPLNFVMERQMLLGMKARAERTLAAS